MKIVIGIIVVLGLGWLVLGMGGEDVATDQTDDTMMEEGAMEEGMEGSDEGTMEEAMMEETGEAMIEAGAEMEATGEAMMEEGEAMLEGDVEAEASAQ